MSEQNKGSHDSGQIPLQTRLFVFQQNLTRLMEAGVFVGMNAFGQEVSIDLNYVQAEISFLNSQGFDMHGRPLSPTADSADAFLRRLRQGQ